MKHLFQKIDYASDKTKNSSVFFKDCSSPTCRSTGRNLFFVPKEKYKCPNNSEFISNYFFHFYREWVFTASVNIVIHQRARHKGRRSGNSARENWINQSVVREGKREGCSVNEVRREGGIRGGCDESCSLSPCINPLQWGRRRVPATPRPASPCFTWVAISLVYSHHLLCPVLLSFQLRPAPYAWMFFTFPVLGVAYIFFLCFVFS